MRIKGFYDPEWDDDDWDEEEEDNGPEYFDKVENYGSSGDYVKTTIIKIFGITIFKRIFEYNEK